MFQKLTIVTLVLVFAFAATALAQEEEFHVEGAADNQFPIDLAPNTEYEFAFDVFNDAGGDVAVKEVSITLPSTSYTLGDYDMDLPGLGDEFTWEGEFDEDTATLNWVAIGPTSSAEMGDIREGEMLTFSFIAMTDTDASDGFSWVLRGDDGGATTLSGVFFFSGEDDDIDGDDDDDDDDDDGGCGC